MNYEEIEDHVKQFNIKNYDKYDFVQIGYISLINAVDKYDTSKHSFSSYVYSAIKKQ